MTESITLIKQLLDNVWKCFTTTHRELRDIVLQNIKLYELWLSWINLEEIMKISWPLAP